MTMTSTERTLTERWHSVPFWPSRDGPVLRTRFVIGTVAFVLLGVLGSMLGYVYEASAAEDVPDTFEKLPPPGCNFDPGTACTDDASHYAKGKFGDGRMGRASGFVADNIYRNKEAARDVWINKLRREMNDRAARGEADFRLLAGAEPTFQGMTPTQLYHHIRQNATCIGGSNYPAYATSPTRCLSYRDAPSGGGLTTDQVKDLGTVVFCGGSVILGIWSGGATTAGRVLLSAFWGGAACGWGAWISVSNP